MAEFITPDGDATATAAAATGRVPQVSETTEVKGQYGQ